MLRVDPAIHAAAIKAAKRERLSLNQGAGRVLWRKWLTPVTPARGQWQVRYVMTRRFTIRARGPVISHCQQAADGGNRIIKPLPGT
jgi:hypothetical protein